MRVGIEEGLSPDELHAAAGPPTQRARPADPKPGSGVSSVVKVGGLPHSITAPEVLGLFWGWPARPGGVHVSASAEAGPLALVDFEAAEHAAAAVAHRHGTTVTTAAGVFQLSVQPASRAEWEAAAARQASDGIVRVKGLPPRATAADVAAFFQVRRGGGLRRGGACGGQVLACAPPAGRSTTGWRSRPRPPRSPVAGLRRAARRRACAAVQREPQLQGGACGV